VTRHGKKVMSILPSQQYEELQKAIAELQETIEAYQETLEVLRDEELMEGIRQGMKDIEEGRVTPLDDVLKELGWE
ncbi:MAG: hypothetical protein M3Z24_00160, partial [Chloroflexota bacterium]|nr:hypothetical protein [Chloroflexota bacterium]